MTRQAATGAGLSASPESLSMFSRFFSGALRLALLFSLPLSASAQALLLTPEQQWLDEDPIFEAFYFCFGFLTVV